MWLGCWGIVSFLLIYTQYNESYIVVRGGPLDTRGGFFCCCCFFFKKKKFVQQIVQEKFVLTIPEKKEKFQHTDGMFSCPRGGYLVRIHKGNKLSFGLGNETK